MNAELNEAALTELIELFYARARSDDLIGPLFNEAVHDWSAHLQRLQAFWSSVMLTSGRYRGNPMAMHLKHRARLTPAMFERWLSIWKDTTEQLLPSGSALAIQAKAERIAESLQLALQLETPDGKKAMLGNRKKSAPYKSTPVFDNDTLPDALRRAHSTKEGTWGVIRVLEGRLRYVIENTGETLMLDPDNPGRVRPLELHHVETVGRMRMQVDFFDHEPGPALS